MKKTAFLLFIWIGVCQPQAASGHGYHEFSHSIAPNVQSQVLDVLEKSLVQLPTPSRPKSANPTDTPESLVERLLERMDLGNMTTNQVLKKEFENSPLAQIFHPIGLPLFIEEMVSMMAEYQEHGKPGIPTFLTPNTVSRIRAIEIKLNEGKK